LCSALENGNIINRNFAGEFNYCHLLKRTQLTFTAWVQTINTGGDGRGDTIFQKQDSPSLLDVDFLTHAGRHLIGISLITSLLSNVRTALTTQTTAITELSDTHIHY
jgi:hypothetical protein